MALTFSDQANSVETYIRDSEPDLARGTDTFTDIGENNVVVEKNRTLIKWDLSSIPKNAIVSSAILSIYVSLDYSSNARTMSAYRVLRNWVENQATWNSYSTGNAWGTAGCSNTSTDREATDIGTASVTATQAANSEIAITLTAGKVQEWISGATANYGVLLQVDTELNDMYRYFTHEDATSATRPKLVITYTLTGNFIPFL